jgi:hypothetical protein
MTRLLTWNFLDRTMDARSVFFGCAIGGF